MMLMIDKMKLKKLYQKFIFSNRFLKLSKLFHFEKIVPNEFFLTEEDKCLFLSPHPDDETIGCGGILLKYPNNFDIVCLTDGSRGTHDDKDISQIRRSEFELVMDEIKPSSYEFLNIQDGKLAYNYTSFSQINIEKYDYIFVPNYFDQHKDHKAVALLLKKLIKEQKYKKSLQIAFYEVWSAFGIANSFVDISGQIETKKKLINMYKSQVEHVDFTGRISALNYYRGMVALRQYVEALNIVDLKTFMKL